MALAFKRAVADAEKAVEAANTSIKGWYSPPVAPALVVDYDGIKTVEGVSKQNPNEEEKPKNITLCNWVADNANNFHSVWGDVQYKDSTNALPIMNKHVEKVVVHVDDKGVAGKYNSYSVEVKGKDVHITVHIDFTNYPQALNLTDETSGPSVDQLVWAHLDKVANISYELRKIALISGALTTYQNYLKDKLKKDIPLSVDWDSVVALQGESLEYQDKPLVPNRARAINLLGDDGKAIYNAYYAIDGLCKDDMGTEAFLETFDKVVVGILPGPVVEDFSGAPKITKEGKTLKLEFQFATAYAGNARWDYSEMAKAIEALL